MQLREYITSDCEQLAKLFFQTVHSVNAKDYTKEQERLILRTWTDEDTDSLFEYAKDPEVGSIAG